MDTGLVEAFERLFFGMMKENVLNKYSRALEDKI